MHQIQPDSIAYKLRAVLYHMRWYFTPTLVIAGILGNTLSILILLTSQLRYVSATHYLVGTAVVNTLYLVSLGLRWLNLFGIDVYNSAGWCQFISFSNSVCEFLSIWYVVSFTVDRYIRSCWIKQAHDMCTPFRAKSVLLSQLLVAIVVYMNISLTVGVVRLRGRPECAPLSIFYHDLRILDTLDIIINVMIPHSAIMVLILVMWWRWHHPIKGSIANALQIQIQSQMRLQQWPSSSTRSRSAGKQPTSHQPGPELTFLELRRLSASFLLTVLFLRLPAEVFRVVRGTRRLIDLEEYTNPAEDYMQVLAIQLLHISLAVHLPVYVATCEGFAGKMARYVSGICHKISKINILGSDKQDLVSTTVETSLQSSGENNNTNVSSV